MQLLTLTLRKEDYNLYEQHSAQLDLTFYSGKLNGRTEKIKKNPDNPVEKAFKQWYRFSFPKFNISLSLTVLLSM